MDNIDSIDTQIDARSLRSKRMKLEAKHFKQNVVPSVEGSIGLTFVYRNNNYGSSYPGQMWDEFKKIVDVVIRDRSAWLICERCSVDCEGKAILQTDADLVRGLPIGEQSGWSRCEPEEYEAARAKTVAAIHSPDKFKAHFLSKP